MSQFLLKDTESKDAFKSWLVRAMQAYGRGGSGAWNDEDTLCEHFLSTISGVLTTPTGDLQISRHKTRGRGPGAPEKKLGADVLFLVNIKTAQASLNGFCLIQAKKALTFRDPLRNASRDAQVMLGQTAASYVMVLLPTQVAMCGAMAVHASRRTDAPLSEIPYVSFPRFASEQLLHGIMLEPFSSHPRILTPELKAEIGHILMIVGAAKDSAGEARTIAEQQLAELRFDFEQGSGNVSPGDG